ncbi:MAG: hypothetical protein EAZ91_14475 [Cytophagales bacterium]|nr:MAG: hypothetical protein EAZ91_14475 [Cytophagales bacterium]
MQTINNSIRDSQETALLSRIIKWSWIILLAASATQLVFFWSEDLLAAILFSTISWKLFVGYFLRENILQKFPLSSLLVAGFVVTQLYFPIVFTTLEAKSAVNNLLMPNEVFLHTTLAFWVLLIAHITYTYIGRGISQSLRSALLYSGFFRTPNNTQVWLMGMVGLGVMTIGYFTGDTQGLKIPDTIVGKILWGLSNFTYAPYLILVGHLYGNNTKVTKKTLVALSLYTILVFAASIARNSRGAFIFGFTSLGIAYIISLLLGIYNIQRVKIFTARNFLIGALAVWLITGPIADLGIAMALVRGSRSEVSSAKLLEMTLEMYQDKSAIEVLKKIDNNEQLDWDERYLDNIFLARFCNLKFCDSSLMLASKVGGDDESVLERTINSMLSALPEPVLVALGIDVNKKEARNGSIADYLFYKSGANADVIGTFRVGHFSGIGMATFGWIYLLLLCITIIPIYIIFDSYSGLFKPNVKSQKTRTMFSFCGLLILTSIFQFLPSESVTVNISYLLRNWPETVVLYFLVYKATYLFSVVVRKFA